MRLIDDLLILWATKTKWTRRKSLMVDRIAAKRDREAEHISGPIGRVMDGLNRKRLLSELLAVIHRDGGHRENEIGTEAAMAEAVEIVAGNNSGRG